MNAACPVFEFASDAAAVERFADLLRTGFENPEGVRGAVRIRIPELPDQGAIPQGCAAPRVCLLSLSLPSDAATTSNDRPHYHHNTATTSFS